MKLTKPQIQALASKIAAKLNANTDARIEEALKSYKLTAEDKRFKKKIEAFHKNCEDLKKDGFYISVPSVENIMEGRILNSIGLKRKHYHSSDLVEDITLSTIGLDATVEELIDSFVSHFENL